MKATEPIYTLNDNVWLYYERATGECIMDLKIPGYDIHRDLSSAVPLGSEVYFGPPKKQHGLYERVLKMINEAWLAVLMSNVNPRVLHNEMMKIQEYQEFVCPEGAAQRLPVDYCEPGSNGARKSLLGEVQIGSKAASEAVKEKAGEAAGNNDDWKQ